MLIEQALPASNVRGSVQLSVDKCRLLRSSVKNMFMFIHHLGALLFCVYRLRHVAYFLPKTQQLTHTHTTYTHTNYKHTHTHKLLMSSQAAGSLGVHIYKHMHGSFVSALWSAPPPHIHTQFLQAALSFTLSTHREPLFWPQVALVAAELVSQQRFLTYDPASVMSPTADLS